MKWLIYKHTNKINGKVYIGQTKQNPNNRWAKGRGYESQLKFYRAILKYGWNNFEHEIIEDNIPTQELANEREIYWIEFQDSVNNGYNTTPGGYCKQDAYEQWEDDIIYEFYPREGSLGCFNRINSDKRIKKARTISSILGRAYKLGIKYINSALDRMSEEEINILKKNYSVLGYATQRLLPKYTLSEIMSAAHKLHLDNPQHKPFICIETQEIFESQSECCNKMFNGKQCSISPVLSGKLNTVKGYHFAFVSDINRQKELAKFINTNPVAKKNHKIICIETQDIYNSIKEATEKTSINGISSALRSTSHIAGGYHWCYIEDKHTLEKLNKFVGQQRLSYNDCFINNKHSKQIVCVETGQIYPSISEAKRILGHFSIWKALKDPNKTAGGYHWKYVEE